jgi:type IV pilus assembly protein PilM
VFKKIKPLIGLDIGSSTVKLLQLSETKRGYSLEKFGITPLDPELIVDGTVMDAGRVTDAIRQLVAEQNSKIRDVALAVSGNSVIIKKIQVPVMSEDELEESIKWEAEQYIPFDINDVNIDFQILTDDEATQTRDQMNVVLVAVKKDKLNEYTALITEAGLVPVVVDVDAFTLENMYCVNYDVKESEVVALVNIGASVMNINIVKGGNYVFTRDISTGGNRYTESVQKDLNLSYDEAELCKRGSNVEGVNSEALSAVIENVNAEVASEITRSFDYFRTTSLQEKVDRVVLSGGCARTRGLMPFLSERLGLKVEMANPFNHIEINPKLFDMQYIRDVAPQAAVGVGLAMRRLADR